MSPEAEALLAEMRDKRWEVFSEDGRVFFVVARRVEPSVVKELYGAGALDAVRGFPRGWHYSAFPVEAASESGVQRTGEKS